MKKLLTVAATAIFVTICAHQGLQAKSFDIEVYDSMPPKPYAILAPVSAKKFNVSAAWNKMMKQANKLNADAIIKFHCSEGSYVFNSGYQNKTGYNASQMQTASCSGLAVRWTDGTSKRTK